MNKPASLRAALAAAIPALASDPEKLTVFIDQGSIAATGGASLSFEYRYVCNVIALDYAGDADEIFVAVVAWARANQPDLFTNFDQRPNGIMFEVDILDNATADVSIKLQLTESVVVTVADDGTRTFAHVDDSIVPKDAAGNDLMTWVAQGG